MGLALSLAVIVICVLLLYWDALEEGVARCVIVFRGELVGALAEGTAVVEATDDAEKGAV